MKPLSESIIKAAFKKFKLDEAVDVLMTISLNQIEDGINSMILSKQFDEFKKDALKDGGVEMVYPPFPHKVYFSK